MNSQHAARRALYAPPLFWERKRGSDARNGSDEYIDARLRVSLAREQTLLRQNEKLILQQKVLTELLATQENSSDRIASLTPRERQIMELVLAGDPSKNIAADLGLSQRTVENHRASIMRKTGSKCVAALARFALAAVWNGTDEPTARQSRLLAAS